MYPLHGLWLWFISEHSAALTHRTWKRGEGLMTPHVTIIINKGPGKNPNFYLAGQVSHTVTCAYCINKEKEKKKKVNLRMYLLGLNQPVGQGRARESSSPYSCANVCVYMDCVSTLCVSMTITYPSVTVHYWLFC